MPRLETKALTVEYRSGDSVIRPISELDLSIEDGELAVLLGASGCGKTTLLSTLATILTPTSGTVHLGDQEVTALRGADLTEYRRSGVGVVFQAFNLIPSLTAVDNVAVPLWSAGIKGSEARTRATELLLRVGLGERLHHRPSDLSGGQAQRVAIARALVHEPPLVLADEPTAHLDFQQVDGVIQLLRTLASPGRVVVVATHDERLLPIADRIVELTARGDSNSAPVEVRLEDGGVLYREGDHADRVYVVVSGRIELRRTTPSGTEIVSVAEPNVYFGELAPALGLPRPTMAVAVGPTVVTSLSVADFRRHVRNAS